MKKARGHSSVGIVNSDGTRNSEAGNMHEHCKKAMQHKADELEALKRGGFEVLISSGAWHAAESVHELYYIIEPQSYEWSTLLGGGAWYPKDVLIAKLEALGNTVRVVPDSEAEKIVHGQRSRFFLSDGSGKPAKPMAEALAGL